MVKFGKTKKREPFYLSEMRHYMNTYVGVSGRISQQASTTAIQLTSLIRIHPDFRFHPSETKQTGQWQYIGKINEEE